MCNSFRADFFDNGIKSTLENNEAIEEAYLLFKNKYKISMLGKLTYADIGILIAKCIANDFPTGKIITLALISSWLNASTNSADAAITINYSATHIGEDNPDDVKFKFHFYFDANKNNCC